MSDFVSFPLLGLSLVIKLRNFNLKSHWNTSILFDKKILQYFLIKNDLVSDLNMPHGQMSDFVSFSLFGFMLVIKLRNFDFQSHWNTSKIFDKKDLVSDLNMPHRKMPDLCHFHCLGSLLSHKTKKFRFWRSLKYFNIFW